MDNQSEHTSYMKKSNVQLCIVNCEYYADIGFRGSLYNICGTRYRQLVLSPQMIADSYLIRPLQYSVVNA